MKQQSHLPAHWAELEVTSPFAAMVGTIYTSVQGLEPEEGIRFGMRVEANHCNASQICHAGMLATFVNVVLARSLERFADDLALQLVTMNMNLDYLAAARCGAWLESRSQVLCKSRRTGFVQALIYDGEALVLRGSGIFKLRARTG